MKQRSESLGKFKEYGKYQDFFSQSAKKKDFMFEENNEYQNQYLMKNKLVRNNSMTTNMQILQQKSSIRGKIDIYLTDNRKIGVLDQISSINKKVLTKIHEASNLVPHNEIDQNKTYINSLKHQFNQVSFKNNKTQAQIRNIQARISQTKEKIIFYQQILGLTLQEQQEELKRREKKIIQARYQSDIYLNMRDTLKLINQTWKKKIKTTLTLQKTQNNRNLILNQMSGNTKESIDKKEYATRMYNSLEKNKTTNIMMKSNAAKMNLQIQKAGQILKKRQEAITLIDRDDYQREILSKNHINLMAKLRTMKFLQILVIQQKNRNIKIYEQYERNYYYMKMSAFDADFEVKKSYYRSFQLTKQLQDKIEEKQGQIKALSLKNQNLLAKWLEIGFGEDDLNSKDKKKNHFIQLKKKLAYRQQRATKNKAILGRIKLWNKKQGEKLGIKISKKSSVLEYLQQIILSLTDSFKQLDKIKTVSQPKLQIK